MMCWWCCRSRWRRLRNGCSFLFVNCAFCCRVCAVCGSSMVLFMMGKVLYCCWVCWEILVGVFRWPILSCMWRLGSILWRYCLNLVLEICNLLRERVFRNSGCRNWMFTCRWLLFITFLCILLSNTVTLFFGCSVSICLFLFVVFIIW